MRPTAYSHLVRNCDFVRFTALSAQEHGLRRIIAKEGDFRDAMNQASTNDGLIIRGKASLEEQLQMDFLLGRMSPLARVRHLNIIRQMRQCFK